MLPVDATETTLDDAAAALDTAAEGEAMVGVTVSLATSPVDATDAAALEVVAEEANVGVTVSAAVEPVGAAIP